MMNIMHDILTHGTWGGHSNLKLVIFKFISNIYSFSITWANVDLDLCGHMLLLGHNESQKLTNFKQMKFDIPVFNSLRPSDTYMRQ